MKLLSEYVLRSFAYFGDRTKFANLARETGYPMYCWNGDIYLTSNSQETGLNLSNHGDMPFLAFVLWNSSKRILGGDMNDFALHAKEAGYNFFCWNGEMHEIDQKGNTREIGVKMEDVVGNHWR